MRKLFGPLLFVATLVGTFLSNVTSSPKPVKADAEYQIAEPGMVAYAASYSSNPTNEPKYSTQYNKTFQYLHLGNTLNSYRGDSVKVGIIDSGINYDHEDFMVSGSTKSKVILNTMLIKVPAGFTMALRVMAIVTLMIP